MLELCFFLLSPRRGGGHESVDFASYSWSATCLSVRCGTMNALREPRSFKVARRLRPSNPSRLPVSVCSNTPPSYQVLRFENAQQERLPEVSRKITNSGTDKGWTLFGLQSRSGDVALNFLISLACPRNETAALKGSRQGAIHLHFPGASLLRPIRRP